MSRTVHVKLGERSYEINIGRDLVPCRSLAEEPGLRALVVSDSNVDPLYGARCEQQLQSLGIAVKRAVVPAGENSKSLSVAGRLYDEAVRAGLDRGSVIVALGGGMVGDLAGFVAATFLRGIRLVQAPTTLLAMVDSSVGGKTAVNLDAGKNLVGVFHQPVEVTIDMATLATLPEREYISGLAEVVKYGVIWDAVLFRQLEESADKLLARDPAVLEEVIARCCEIKAEVVAMDEKESGVRSILNFGHTLGHAVEKVCGYGAMLHGEAVAVGMVFAGEVSVRQQKFPVEEQARLVALVRRLRLPAAPPRGTQWAALRDAMAADKKTRRSIPRFVLAERFGSVVFGCEVDEAVLEQAYASVG